MSDFDSSIKISENYLFIHMFAHDEGTVNGLQNAAQLAKNCSSIRDFRLALGQMLMLKKQVLDDFKRNLRLRAANKKSDDT